MAASLVPLLGVSAASAVTAPGWGLAVTLSAPGAGKGGAGSTRPVAAVDKAGDVQAVWWQSTPAAVQIWTARHPRGGVWSKPVALSSSTAIEVSYPQIFGAADGSAVVVWPDSEGIETVDLHNGVPGKQHLLVALAAGTATAPDIQISGNSRGDVAVGWQNGTARTPTSSVHVLVRRPGQDWAPAADAASVSSQAVTDEHLELDSVRVGGDGTVLVGWEHDDITCTPRRCQVSGYILHVTRFGSTWTSGAGGVDSGALTAADSGSHGAIAVADAHGRASVLWDDPAGGVLEAEQLSPTVKWGTPVTRFAKASGTAVLTSLWDVQVNDTGAILGLLIQQQGPVPDIGSGKAIVLRGTLASTAVWTRAQLTNYPVQEVHAALASSGAAAVCWINQDADTTAGRVQSSISTGPGTAFGTVQDVAATNSGDHVAVTIDDAAHATAFWEEFPNNTTSVVNTAMSQP